VNERTETAFIFARGGSKGVKDKNIRPVAGRPLLAHAIAGALASRFIARVVVSTDSERIAQVAREHGAEVLLRPAELAGDATPELLAWKHAITARMDDLRATRTFISLPATSPLRAPQDIDAAITTFRAGGCDVLFGVAEGHRNPYLNMVTVDAQGLIHIVNAKGQVIRRQDVPEVFDVTTLVYVGNIDYLQTCERLMQGRVGHVKIPVERSLDVDTEFDLHLADLLLRHPFAAESAHEG